MNLSYRLAKAEDISSILALYAPFVQNTTITFEYDVPTLADFTQRFVRITQDFPWYVCEDAGHVIGYAYADRAFERAAFSWDADLSVYIHPDYHHRGIGTRFYQLLESDLTAKGYHNLYALITGENENSRQFHEAMGFALLGTLPATGFKHGKWLSLYWYGKRLRSSEEKPTAFPNKSSLS